MMDEPYLKIVKCLNSRRVRYVVIGGNAAAHHGVPRGTFDLDVFIEATLDNADRVLRALRDARFGTIYLTTAERMLLRPITEFNDWLPVDVMTQIPGVKFETAFKNRVFHRFGGVRVPFISRRDLIRAKRASGRDVDIADVHALMNRKRK
jgi:hypothetical protein